MNFDKESESRFFFVRGGGGGGMIGLSGTGSKEIKSQEEPSTLYIVFKTVRISKKKKKKDHL